MLNIEYPKEIKILCLMNALLIDQFFKILSYLYNSSAEIILLLISLI